VRRGAIASVADSANGFAAYTLAPSDTDVLAVEFKINLLAPAKGAAFWPAAAFCARGGL
jgi:acyl-coenzyme A thioesterase PaaI-like protein